MLTISKATVLRWAQNGDIAEKIGDDWFVMVDAEIFSTGSNRVDDIL